MSANTQTAEEIITLDSHSAGIPIKRLFHYHDTLSVRVQMLAAVLSAMVLLLGLAYVREGQLPGAYRQLALLTGFMMWGVYSLVGVFRRSGGRRNGLLRISKAWLTVVALVLVGGFITKTTDEYSRLVLGSWAVVGYFSQAAVYLVIDALHSRFSDSVREPKRTLVVGSGRLARHLVDAIGGNRWLPDEVVGIVDNNKSGRDAWNRTRCPVLGRTADILELVERHRIKRVYVAVPLNQSDMLESLHHKLVKSNIDVIWAPDIFSLPLINHGSREVAGVPLLSLSESPMSAESRLAVKSTLDV
ncbi:MAG: undecaprenyl-phosphate glucose phosphotransferase, partial [Pseudomonadota bacterium]